MAAYFIEECQERIALYSKLLMATIGIMVIDAGGMASTLAMKAEPWVFGATFGLLEAGAMVLALCCVAIYHFLRIILNLINQIGAYNG